MQWRRRGWLENIRLTETCRPGLSPHAPYSVSSTLFQQAGELASVLNLPLAIHVAETLAERELIQSHTGPFVAFLQELGVWDEAQLVGDLSFGPRNADEQWSSDPPRTLFIHGNYLDVNAAPDHRSSIVYCPRTHAYFNHPSHPFREILAKSVRVALGTDSLASNPDLDLLAEARFIHHRYPEFSCSTLLWMATLAGTGSAWLGRRDGKSRPGEIG